MPIVKCRKCNNEYRRSSFSLDTGFCPACKPNLLLLSIRTVSKGFVGGTKLGPDEREKVGHIGMRIGIGIIAMVIAFPIGLGYQHKCEYGNKPFEWSMTFAYPLIALAVPVVSRYTKISLILSALLLLAGCVLRSPYLNCIH